MTRQEIEKKIEELENRQFMLNMVDRWTNEQRRLAWEISDEIRNLKAQLRK